MLKLLGSLIGLFDKFMGWWTARQQQEIGRIIERAETTIEAAAIVEKVNEAVTIDDPARTERLRNRFDRARNTPHH
jgi:hypothetical protein